MNVSVSRRRVLVRFLCVVTEGGDWCRGDGAMVTMGISGILHLIPVISWGSGGVVVEVSDVSR